MWPFQNKTLGDHLRAEKTLRIKGIRFKIKKINIMDYLDGSKVLKKAYDTYQIKPSEDGLLQTKSKIKSVYRDVFMAAVMRPILSRKEDDAETIWVDDIFNDWALASELYSQIYLFTYGKKKLT